MGFHPTVHIIDCTKIPINIVNDTYKKSDIVKIAGETMRGYKMEFFRLLARKGEQIEKIRFCKIIIKEKNGKNSINRVKKKEQDLYAQHVEEKMEWPTIESKEHGDI